MSARRGLYGEVVEDLGRGIVHGALPADAPIAPDELCERYRVSRSVVREVLRLLESKGLVAAKQAVGTRVLAQEHWHGMDLDVLRWRLTGPDRATASHELRQLRSALEPLAARLAATAPTARIRALRSAMDVLTSAIAGGDAADILAADIAFHAALFDAAGNAVLRDLTVLVAAALDDQQDGVAAHGFSAEAEALHVRLVEAVERGDGDAAASATALLVAHVPDRT